jgi:Methyltransferase domain
MGSTTSKTDEAREFDYTGLDIFKSYQKSKYLSLKHSTYFAIYDDLLQRYRGKPITFVEVGVLNGGSLFMWRDYFGPHARIIGVDFNPGAKKWEKDGFEIFIGDQGSPAFWQQLFGTLGTIDVLLDDGGHTNTHQIVTTELSLPHIRDGGMVIVEDVHASYLKSFGNPSRYSFINYAKATADSINGRFPEINSAATVAKGLVFSVGFYESIVSFHVDRRKCFVGKITSNNGVSSDAEDFRHVALKENLRGPVANFVKNTPVLRPLARAVFDALIWGNAKWQNFKLRKYF